MPGFYMESCTRLKWVKKEYSLPQIFSLVCQIVSEEVLLTGPKNARENLKLFWRLRVGRGSDEHPLSNGEEFRNIQHSKSTVLDPGSHTWFIVALYYKMRQLFYYKMWQKFITKCLRFFITKCDRFITKCDSYYKLLQFYYKMRQLLQNVTSITNCVSTNVIKQTWNSFNTKFLSQWNDRKSSYQVRQVLVFFTM